MRFFFLLKHIKFKGQVCVLPVGNPGVQTDQSQLDSQDRSQQIARYEVALGTDRRFNNTRYDVVPYTDVGTNTTATFYDLNLTPGTATYYFTVIAYSKSFSKTMVTSNGFTVGDGGGITGRFYIIYIILISKSQIYVFHVKEKFINYLICLSSFMNVGVMYKDR